MDKRVMSYEGHVIWHNTDVGCFGFAKGDGTDNWYETIEEAMRAIDRIEAEKKARRAKKVEG